MRPDDFAGHWIFKVVRQMGNTFSDLLEAHCTAHGLSYMVTPSQWAALAWLEDADGIPIGTLAQHLGIEASVTTGIVQRLEQHGLLERVHDNDDRRLVKIFLTDSGRKVVQALEPVAMTFHERLFQGFSSEEQQTFLAYLQQLNSNLSSISPDLLSPIFINKTKETNS